MTNTIRDFWTHAIVLGGLGDRSWFEHRPKRWINLLVEKEPTADQNKQRDEGMVEMKKAFFKRIADDLHNQLKVRREDVIINIVEVAKDNWSFGGGVAQYAE